MGDLPGKTQNLVRVDAGFIKHTQITDGGLYGHVPARPERTTPLIRFLFVVPRFWIGLPPGIILTLAVISFFRAASLIVQDVVFPHVIIR